MHSHVARPLRPHPPLQEASRDRVRGWAVALLALVLLAAGCGESALDVTVRSEADPAGARKKVPASSTFALAGAALYVDPSSHARRQADLWRAERPADAAMLEKIAGSSQAYWLGEWSGDIRGTVGGIVRAAALSGAVPVLVAYNIPQRDCGGLSGGGGVSAEAYRSWVAALADGIGSYPAAVIVEPDALAAMDCLSAADQQVRVDLLRHAVSTFKAKPRAIVYIDAGHARWHSAATMGDRLRRAGVSGADGFSLNVSNFLSDDSSVAYGRDVSGYTGGKRFVVDSSRNGAGPTVDNQWCNPEGRALGRRPTTSTGLPLVDAFLWIKRPGESDGACNGGPDAGQWWAEYALGLAQRAGW